MRYLSISTQYGSLNLNKMQAWHVFKPSCAFVFPCVCKKMRISRRLTIICRYIVQPYDINSSWCVHRLSFLCFHAVYGMFDEVGTWRLENNGLLFRNFKLFFIVIMVFILFITRKAVISRVCCRNSANFLLNLFEFCISSRSDVLFWKGVTVI